MACNINQQDNPYRSWKEFMVLINGVIVDSADTLRESIVLGQKICGNKFGFSVIAHFGGNLCFCLYRRGKYFGQNRKGFGVY